MRGRERYCYNNLPCDVMQLCATTRRLLDISAVVNACHSIHQRHTFLCCSPSNTFRCRTLNRPVKGRSVTVQISQHYGATCCLGLWVRMWYKWCNPQVPAEGQIRCHQVSLCSVSCNEDVQMKDASEEAVVYNVLSGCLLRTDAHWERRQQFSHESFVSGQ